MTMINHDGERIEVDWSDINERIDWITIDSFGSDCPDGWEGIAFHINESIRNRLEEYEFNEDDLDTIADEYWDAFWNGELVDWITRETFTKAFGENIPKNWKAIADAINNYVQERIERGDYKPAELITMVDEAWIAYWRNKCYEDWGVPAPEYEGRDIS